MYEKLKKEGKMSYIKTIKNTKSRFLLEKGERVFYNWYNYPNGARWIVKYRDKFYKIIHDGTGNQFFHSHAPLEITKERAKEILSNYSEAWKKAQSFGWWNETLDEYLEKKL